jgi:hypothetical protein
MIRSILWKHKIAFNGPSCGPILEMMLNVLQSRNKSYIHKVLGL